MPDAYQDHPPGGTNENDCAVEPAKLRLDQIAPNPFQPREHLRDDDLAALTQSIRTSGVLQPIVVRPKADGRYEIIAGERRWRACRQSGLDEIPVAVRQASDEEMLELALVENIFREDLNPIDRAKAYRRYCDEFGLSPEDVAERLGEDRTTVTNYIRLLDLPEEVRQWVIEDKLAMGHARCLLGLKSASELVQVARAAIDRSLSVRALERLVRERADRAKTAAGRDESLEATKRPQIKTLEESFIRTLNTKVEILESRRKGSGKIVIHYYNLDDFDRVAERLGVPTD